ncbi:MAG: DUF4139 domain-containing protein [Geobacteraceae bacterium]|nr:DUF4139 domain-containing protein [Geobacteraceae bacterium]NTW81435.1 DUF4139 domain-containing protein [Geobacteraceae bacterium]
MRNTISILTQKNNRTRAEGNYMRIKLICICLIAFSTSSAFAENRTTFYRDGALHQMEVAAVKGATDLPLADGLLEQSLKVFPAPGTTILGVDIRRSEAGRTPDKELETLAEQRRRLEDRLQALETREAIFTSAAKTQSGKAPRKSKTNPDPMQAIRQGTDFAIAQLEAVYTARRRTNQEIHKIDAHIAKTKKGSRSLASSVRIAVTPPRGKVTIHYATAEHGWQPEYNLYLNGDGTARLQLSAKISGKSGEHQVLVSSGSIFDSTPATAMTPHAGSSAILASYKLPLTDERFGDGIFNKFSGTITNPSMEYLPPGDSGFYRNGVYLGKFRFEGLSTGRSRVISLGK